MKAKTFLLSVWNSGFVSGFCESLPSPISRVRFSTASGAGVGEGVDGVSEGLAVATTAGVSAGAGVGEGVDGVSEGLAVATTAGVSAGVGVESG